jgi:hypothetical protein
VRRAHQRIPPTGRPPSRWFIRVGWPTCRCGGSVQDEIWCARRSLRHQQAVLIKIIANRRAAGVSTDNDHGPWGAAHRHNHQNTCGRAVGCAARTKEYHPQAGHQGDGSPGSVGQHAGAAAASGKKYGAHGAPHATNMPILWKIIANRRAAGVSTDNDHRPWGAARRQKQHDMHGRAVGCAVRTKGYHSQAGHQGDGSPGEVGQHADAVAASRKKYGAHGAPYATSRPFNCK